MVSPDALWQRLTHAWEVYREFYIRDAADIGALKVVVVKLLHSSGEVSRRLVFDEAILCQYHSRNHPSEGVSVPFAGAARVTLTVDFAVDDIEAGLTSEIFEVLYVNSESGPPETSPRRHQKQAYMRERLPERDTTR